MAEPTSEPGDTRPSPPSFGNMGEHHWSRARAGMNREAIEYYRARSRAPGVAGGGAERNHYCMRCNGVVPLAYDQRQPASDAVELCPHCGAPLERRVRAMFNWVEIDQVPSSDLRALLPFALLVLAALVVAAAVWLLGWTP